ncbi:hypothetical protein [Pseudomonas sp.]|uniref:hypothetical protein n=1 Tax=Pseudomonas sp. TaxID=306 RepID=UPI003F9DAC69
MSIEAIGTLNDHAYHGLIPSAQRAVAVTAALELIQSRVSTLPTGTSLDVELGKLSMYADKIQAALIVKE